MVSPVRERKRGSEGEGKRERTETAPKKSQTPGKCQASFFPRVLVNGTFFHRCSVNCVQKCQRVPEWHSPSLCHRGYHRGAEGTEISAVPRTPQQHPPDGANRADAAGVAEDTLTPLLLHSSVCFISHPSLLLKT